MAMDSSLPTASGEMAVSTFHVHGKPSSSHLLMSAVDGAGWRAVLRVSAVGVNKYVF